MVFGHHIVESAFDSVSKPRAQRSAVILSFRAAGWSNREIGLLVSGHAGYLVRASTICAIAHGRTSGRKLARHFRTLARAWGIL
jgi:hypothetical protein